LTGGMAEALGVESEIRETLGMEFHEMLHQADALITTPSTTLLEGMLCGIPVAMLDYTNSPPYVPAAWTITARDHRDLVLPELLTPPEPRMQFQDMVLHDALECDSPASPRMVKLVERMVEIGGQCRSKGNPLAFPARILDCVDGARDSQRVLLQSGGGAAEADRVELEHFRRRMKEQDRQIRERSAEQPPGNRSFLGRLLGKA